MAVNLDRRLSLRDFSFSVLNFVFCTLRPATNHVGVKIGFLFFFGDHASCMVALNTLECYHTNKI